MMNCRRLGVVGLSIAFAVLIGCTTMPDTGGGPGKRPRSYRVGLFGDKYQQLRDAAWDLKVYAEKMETAPKEQPFYSTVQRRKKDYEDLLAAQREKVKNLLAQDTAGTPGGVQTGPGEGSNKEALELFNSFLNLREFVAAGQSELGGKKATQAMARKFYWALWQALEMMAQMQTTFVERCESVYQPALQQLQASAEEMARQKRAVAEGLEAEGPRAALTQVADRYEKQAMEAEAALPILDAQRAWAEARLPLIKEQITLARQAYEAADQGGAQAAELAGAVSKAFAEAQIEPPPFITFGSPAEDLPEPAAE